MTADSHSHPEARLLLQEAIRAVSSAETLCFDARNLHATGVVRESYVQLNLPVPVTRQRYYSWNCAGTGHVRLESACTAGHLNVTTLFIKNRDGIWLVLPQCAAEVSAVFTPDQLLGTFPFFRFISALEHPYELSVDESNATIGRVAVKGSLTAKPLGLKEDIASEFTYTIGVSDRRLTALDERTFAGRSLHLEFDQWSFNGPINQKLFEFPEKPRITISNLSQYADLMQKHSANVFTGQ